jgi:exosortase
MTTRTTQSRLWIGAGLLTLLAMFATRDAWADIWMIASADEESSHIFLVPVVAVWMAWLRRARLRHIAPRPSPLGPVVVLAGWVSMLVGYNFAMQTLWHGGALVTALGAFISVAGHSFVLRLLPAFVVLGFLVPVPGFIRQAIALPLQTATAAATQTVFDVAGVPVDRMGNLLVVNGVEVAVAEACNGMRMVFALALVAYAFAFSMPLRNWVRLLILVASPIVAIVCNVFRLAPTVWLYGYTERSTADVFHDLSGWLMLPVAFFLLLGIIRALSWALIPVNRFNMAYQ